MSVIHLYTRAMETAEAPTGVETLPNASDMAPDNSRAESGSPGAHDEEEDNDADGAADATQGSKPKKLRRSQMEVWAEKLLKAEAAAATKQVRCRSMESQISRTPTAVW